MLVPVIAAAAILAALVGAGFATNWFGLAVEKDAEPQKTTSVSVAHSSSSSAQGTSPAGKSAAQHTSSSSGIEAGTAANSNAQGQQAAVPIEQFTISDEVADPNSKDGYKVSGTITNNGGEGCNSVMLSYELFYYKKDNYGDQVETSDTVTKYVYDLPAQTSKDFDLLFTSPENAQNIIRVELENIEAGEYTYTTSEKALTSEEYALENLVGEDLDSCYIQYKGTIANKTDYKWEWAEVSITRAYDANGAVIWDDHGSLDLDRGQFKSGEVLSASTRVDYVKNGGSADIDLRLYHGTSIDLSKNQIDHFDVRVVVKPDTSS